MRFGDDFFAEYFHHMYVDDLVVASYYAHSIPSISEKYRFLGSDDYKKKIEQNTIESLLCESSRRRGIPCLTPRVYFNGPVKGFYYVPHETKQGFRYLGYLVED